GGARRRRRSSSGWRRRGPVRLDAVLAGRRYGLAQRQPLSFVNSIASGPSGTGVVAVLHRKLKRTGSVSTVRDPPGSIHPLHTHTPLRARNTPWPGSRSIGWKGSSGPRPWRVILAMIKRADHGHTG